MHFYSISSIHLFVTLKRKSTVCFTGQFQLDSDSIPKSDYIHIPLCSTGLASNGKKSINYSSSIFHIVFLLLLYIETEINRNYSRSWAPPVKTFQTFLQILISCLNSFLNFELFPIPIPQNVKQFLVSQPFDLKSFSFW